MICGMLQNSPLPELSGSTILRFQLHCFFKFTFETCSQHDSTSTTYINIQRMFQFTFNTVCLFNTQAENLNYFELNASTFTDWPRARQQFSSVFHFNKLILLQTKSESSRKYLFNKTNLNNIPLLNVVIKYKLTLNQIRFIKRDVSLYNYISNGLL